MGKAFEDDVLSNCESRPPDGRAATNRRAAANGRPYFGRKLCLRRRKPFYISAIRHNLKSPGTVVDSGPDDIRVYVNLERARRKLDTLSLRAPSGRFRGFWPAKSS